MVAAAGYKKKRKHTPCDIFVLLAQLALVVRNESEVVELSAPCRVVSSRV